MIGIVSRGRDESEVIGLVSARLGVIGIMIEMESQGRGGREVVRDRVPGSGGGRGSGWCPRVGMRGEVIGLVSARLGVIGIMIEMESQGRDGREVIGMVSRGRG